MQGSGADAHRLCPNISDAFHIALDCFRTPTDRLTTEQLLEDRQQSSEDLCTMLFEYFGKHIVQPRRDLFEKATWMKVSQSSDTGFLTQIEANAAMETCKQIELFQAHATDGMVRRARSQRNPRANAARERAW